MKNPIDSFSPEEKEEFQDFMKLMGIEAKIDKKYPFLSKIQFALLFYLYYLTAGKTIQELTEDPFCQKVGIPLSFGSIQALIVEGKSFFNALFPTIVILSDVIASDFRQKGKKSKSLPNFMKKSLELEQNNQKPDETKE